MKGSLVNKEQREQLAAKFTEKEVKEAMWSIDGNKSPGPYEYGSPFFKDNWEIVGKDVVKGVMEFFRTKKMLTGMNDTTITLIVMLNQWGITDQYHVAILYTRQFQKCYVTD